MSGRARDGREPASHGPVIEARRVGPGGDANHAFGETTYTVLLDPPPESGTGERRASQRRRTRLRSGKIVDAEGRFVTECLVHDLSASGSRLRLPPGTTLPGRIQLYDDQTGILHQAATIWRSDGDVGIAFKPSERTQRSQRIAEEMRRKFYAMRG